MPPPKEVFLNSLSTGRCFTLPKPPPDPAAEKPGKMQKATHTIPPEAAFKILDVRDDGVAVIDAAGKEALLPGTTKVVEIPRDGYDRLVERFRKPPA
jgi:hypothetical protein